MKDLIPVTKRCIGDDTIPTVNTRDLYAYLELSGDYNRWIKSSLKKANLIENIDFIVYYTDVDNPKGGRPATEYHVTFDAAKHIGMMSSVTKGHEVRAYFIAKEKELMALQGQNYDTLLDRYPELKAIAEMAVALAKTKAIAEQAQEDALAAQVKADKAEEKAEQAQANAQRAIEGQAYYTVAEYIDIHGLKRQIPPSDYRALSDHLRLFCLDHNIPFRAIPVGGKAWAKENGYPIHLYEELLPNWLKRRYAQELLSIVPHER